MKLTSKEELFIQLYRTLDPEQQREFMDVFVKNMRAQLHANDVASQVNSGTKLRVIGNARVEQTLGFPKRRAKLPVKTAAKSPPKKTPGRDDDLDPGMDDALG